MPAIMTIYSAQHALMVATDRGSDYGLEYYHAAIVQNTRLIQYLFRIILVNNPIQDPA